MLGVTNGPSMPKSIARARDATIRGLLPGGVGRPPHGRGNRTGAHQREASVRNSSALRRIDADARFSSRCAIDEVPGIGSMAGERCSSQASAIWLGVATWLWAIRASGEFGLANLPAATGTRE